MKRERKKRGQKGRKGFFLCLPRSWSIGPKNKDPKSWSSIAVRWPASDVDPLPFLGGVIYKTLLQSSLWVYMFVNTWCPSGIFSFLSLSLSFISKEFFFVPFISSFFWYYYFHHSLLCWFFLFCFVILFRTLVYVCVCVSLSLELSLSLSHTHTHTHTHTSICWLYRVLPENSFTNLSSPPTINLGWETLRVYIFCWYRSLSLCLYSSLSVSLCLCLSVSLCVSLFLSLSLSLSLSYNLCLLSLLPSLSVPLSLLCLALCLCLPRYLCFDCAAYVYRCLRRFWRGLNANSHTEAIRRGSISTTARLQQPP